MKDEALKLALEALENSIDLVSQEARNAEELYGKYPTRLARIQGLVALEVAHEKAITAIKQALAAPVYVKTFHGGKPWPLHPEPVQEPVALVIDGVLVKSSLPEKYTGHLYTTQPAAQRAWVGLTHEERNSLLPLTVTHSAIDFAKACEAKLKEKNT
jgi:hypothetical protein